MIDESGTTGQYRPVHSPAQNRAYTRPKLTNWGTIADLTKVLGMTFTTDVEMTGSMAHPGGMGG